MDVGERGEICLRARSNPHYPLGYWRNEEAARETFGGDWFHTKDAAKADEDGYVWYEGRADDVIIAAGYRIGPFEVESACLEHPAVAEAAAVASPDERRGNVVKAFIVLAAGAEPGDELADDIKRFVRERLGAHAYPRRIEFVDGLPKTLTGKIRRIELRQQEFEQAAERRSRPPARPAAIAASPRSRRAASCGRRGAAPAGPAARLGGLRRPARLVGGARGGGAMVGRRCRACSRRAQWAGCVGGLGSAVLLCRCRLAGARWPSPCAGRGGATLAAAARGAASPPWPRRASSSRLLKPARWDQLADGLRAAPRRSAACGCRTPARTRGRR